MSIRSIFRKKAKSEEGEKEMTFLEHLEELRWHLIRAVVAIFLVMIVMLASKDFVFNDVFLGPKKDTFPTYQFFCGLLNVMCEAPDFELQAFKVEEKFVTYLKVSLILGLVIAFPYVFWEIWRFIKPGLYEKEKKAARGIVLICSLLFMMGVCFGYFIISPFALSYLTSFNLADIESQPTLSSYVNIMTMFTLPTGIVFELPIVVYFLSKVGLITPSFMKKYRKIAFVAILVTSAIITPPDLTTQFLIGIPLYILYEISILISARVQRDYEKEFGK